MENILRIKMTYDKCLGQDSCQDCPRYLDDCDGKEEEHDKI